MAYESKRMRGQFLKKQQGNILVMFTVGLFVLIAMAALAIDSGHLLLNKSRVQNLSDAAALHAAKIIDDGGSQIQARAGVIEILGLNIAHSDNFEINAAFTNILATDTSLSTSQIYVEFSDNPDPFTTANTIGVDDDVYVKVVINNLPLNNFLADMLNFSKQVSATSLAGPSTAIVECPTDLVPMLVCGNFDTNGAPSPTDGFHDPDPDDGIFEQVEYSFGLPLNDLYLMKIGSNNNSPIGPGNFQLIRLGDSSGGADIRDAMAGDGYSSDNNCAITDDDGNVPTEPGNTVGPSGQGINTRFGVYQGPVNATEHPRDINICQGDHIELDASGAISTATQGNAYRYENYQPDIVADSTCSNTESGDLIVIPNAIDTSVEAGEERRILNVVIGNCNGKNHGSSDIPYMGLGCFFLTQEMTSGGQEAYIIGEFIEKCEVEGIPSGVAEERPGPYKIVLYHVPASNDS